MSDKEVGDNLKNLESKINDFKQKNVEKKPSNSGMSAEKTLAELVAGLLFGLFLGFFLDDYFDTRPLFLITLIILGLAGSFYNIYKEAVKDSNEE